MFDCLPEATPLARIFVGSKFYQLLKKLHGHIVAALTDIHKCLLISSVTGKREVTPIFSGLNFSDRSSKICNATSLS
jgi:hypothetical protein